MSWLFCISSLLISAGLHCTPVVRKKTLGPGFWFPYRVSCLIIDMVVCQPLKRPSFLSWVLASNAAVSDVTVTHLCYPFWAVCFSHPIFYWHWIFEPFFPNTSLLKRRPPLCIWKFTFNIRRNTQKKKITTNVKHGEATIVKIGGQNAFDRICRDFPYYVQHKEETSIIIQVLIGNTWHFGMNWENERKDTQAEMCRKVINWGVFMLKLSVEMRGHSWNKKSILGQLSCSLLWSVSCTI